MKRLLLHHCCAPCSPSVVDHLAARFALTSYWFNPNIHPAEEYALRFDSLLRFVRDRALPLEEGPLVPEEEWVAGAAEAEDRCAYCYRTRLDQAARAARDRGIPFFTTTLLASPWQKHELIRSIAEEASRAYGPAFFYHDFRPGFHAGKAAARTQGYYLQKYCGCRFSREERIAQGADL